MAGAARAGRGRPRVELRAIVGVVGELLLTAGVLVLSFAAWFVWGTDASVAPAQEQAVTRLHERFAAAPAAGRLAPPSAGEEFAVLTIPRVDDDPRPIVEGVGLPVLQRGVGHVPGTALPGEVGNFATAGHRVTYGRPYRHIDRLRPGDPIVVETTTGWSVYRFVRHRIVAPSATEVVAPVPDRPGVRPRQAWMTLIACHPPFSARQRYVGYALLDRTVARVAGPPPELASTTNAATALGAGASGERGDR